VAGKNAEVRIQKLEGTDAFIVFDLDDAAHNIGVTRVAPKILVDGATLLARSTTYLFATFEQEAGGASAGINVKPPTDRAEAIATFVREVQPLVEAGTFLTEPGKGISREELAPLHAVDPRVGFDPREAQLLLGLSAVAAADKARPLDGARVAIEGLDTATLSVVTEAVARGAKVVSVATAKGAAHDAAGLDAAALADAVAAHGAGALETLGLDVAPAGSVFAADADVLFTGSKSGVIDGDVAATIVAQGTVSCVVPIAPVPVTAKGLAVLRHANTVVLPDFLTTCGPLFAMFPEEGASTDDVRAVVVEQVDAVLGEVLDHADGPLLAACYRAESFLKTWQTTLPFGRPLA
jgi:glutamate dehydrogenase (NAD(P)+)